MEEIHNNFGKKRKSICSKKSEKENDRGLGFRYVLSKTKLTFNFIC